MLVDAEGKRSAFFGDFRQWFKMNRENYQCGIKASDDWVYRWMNISEVYCDDICQYSKLLAWVTGRFQGKVQR